MSLINDALKRASQATKRDPKAAPTMEPFQRTSTSRAGGPGMTIILICFVIAGAATLAAWAYWNKKYKTSKPTTPPAHRTAATNGAATAAVPGTNKNPITKAANTLTKVQAQNREGELAADGMQTPQKPEVAGSAANKPTVPAAANPASASVAAEPTLNLPKLQAIFYRANDPSAVVGGKTVRVGDLVEGVRILEIKHQSVRVQASNEIRELTIR